MFATPARQTVHVTYRLSTDRESTQRISPVLLIDGYSNEDSVPAILAVKHFSTNERANEVHVLDIRARD